jgi:predicted RNase H-like HicB family nuclease
MTTRYPAQIFWSDEDEGFIAIATDLPGCSAFGSTQEEALAELQNAIDAWIEAAQAAGNPIPAPSDPATNNGFSGKLLLRMPRALHARLAQEAKTENVSLNQFINFLLTSVSGVHLATQRTLVMRQEVEVAVERRLRQLRVRLDQLDEQSLRMARTSGFGVRSAALEGSPQTLTRRGGRSASPVTSAAAILAGNRQWN